MSECPSCGAEPIYALDTRDDWPEGPVAVEAVPCCSNEDCKYHGQPFARIEDDLQTKYDTQIEKEAVR